MVIIRCLLSTLLIYSTTLAAPLLEFSFSRQSFPEDFLFGASSSAYQYEGAAYEDGRGPSIWDNFTEKHPEKIADRSSGTVATDFYHRFKDDVKLIKEMGLDTFRFSLSWSRILPRGRIDGGVNMMGIEFYNNLINELVAYGIQPLVTLFHYDVPQALEDEYGGFLSTKIVEDYHDYADLCFREFGDRVKYWLTFNEPSVFSETGYAYGTDAPGRCSNYIGNCSSGNSAIEPYQVTHNSLLAHASAYHLYRQRYQPSQNGVIGMTIPSDWFLPYNQSLSSQKAASRAFDFIAGWILDPITFGDYPETMRSIVGSRLPKFTEEESTSLKNSYNFLGLNYYTASYAIDGPSLTTNLSYTTDNHVTVTQVKDGVPIGESTDVDWLYIYPKGILYMLRHLKQNYNNPVTIVTENGVGIANNYSTPIESALKDYLRIKYHKLHLSYLLQAVKEGAKLKGYLVWSLFDDFEWSDGYIFRFGLVYIDYKNGSLARYSKYSALWFKEFIQQREDPSDGLDKAAYEDARE